MIHEDQELPFILDDFPNYHLKTSAVVPERPNNLSEDQFRLDIAHKYLKSLEKVMRQKYQTPQQKQQAVELALDMYDNQFNKILANSIFRDVEFPSSELLEEKFDTDFDHTTKLLYNETCFRHSFSKLFSQQFNIEVAANSWANYGMLFDTLVENKNNADLPIPNTWLWDILDEFVYQFYMCSRWRKNLRGEELATLEGRSDFWNIEEVLKHLNSFIARSGVLDQYFDVSVNNLQTIHYLGYYSLLAMAKVHVMSGDFDNALKDFSMIGDKYLVVYSRSGGAYLTLFTYAGFTYLMKNRFRESATLFQAIVLFYNKYKQLYSKSFQFEQMNKNYEKVVCLLALSMVFYPEPLKDTIRTIFKDIKIKPKERKEQSQGEPVQEKFEKLNKYDIQTFQDIFFLASPKIVQPIKDLNDFKDTKSEQQQADLLNEKREKLQEEFLKIQKLNNISSILKLYNKLTVEKTARLLKISHDELVNLLDLYQQRTQGTLSDTPFEQTIIRKYQGQSSMLTFTIDNHEITVIQPKDSQRELSHQIHQLNSKLEKTLQDLIKLSDQQ